MPTTGGTQDSWFQLELTNERRGQLDRVEGQLSARRNRLEQLLTAHAEISGGTRDTISRNRNG